MAIGTISPVKTDPAVPAAGATPASAADPGLFGLFLQQAAGVTDAGLPGDPLAGASALPGQQKGGDNKKQQDGTDPLLAAVAAAALGQQLRPLQLPPEMKAAAEASVAPTEVKVTAKAATVAAGLMVPAVLPNAKAEIVAGATGDAKAKPTLEAAAAAAVVDRAPVGPAAADPAAVGTAAAPVPAPQPKAAPVSAAASAATAPEKPVLTVSFAPTVALSPTPARPAGSAQHAPAKADAASRATSADAAVTVDRPSPPSEHPRAPAPIEPALLTAHSGREHAATEAVPAAGVETAEIGQSELAPIASPVHVPAVAGSAPTHQPSQAAAMVAPATEQVAVAVRHAAANGEDRIRIELRPESLGKVEVRLDFAQDGRVHAIVTAERHDTLQLLAGDSKALEQALRDAGLQADSSSLSFSMRGGDSGAQAWQQHQQNQQNGASRGHRGEKSESGETAGLQGIESVVGAAAAPTARRLAGAVDISI